MAIFSRRTLQRIINENACFLEKEQLENHVKKLNEGDLSFEWEIVLLNVFSKLGKVTHEPKFENCKRKIDVQFSNENRGLEFLADITCILGKEDKNNVVISFELELKKIIDQNELSGFWNIYIGGNSWDVDFRRKKPELKIPTRGEFATKIFDTPNFKRFIENVKKFPDKKDSYYVRNSEIDLNIKYEPRSFHQIHSSHFDDKTIVSIAQNNIYDSLKRKCDQLLETPYKGNLGIILCDAFGSGFSSGDLVHHSSRNVINEFLFNHKEISFILTVDSKEDLFNFSDRKPKIKIDLYEGFSSDKEKDTFQLLQKDLIKVFPQPVSDVWQARNFLKYIQTEKDKIFSRDYCGLVVSQNEIKISAKMILEILSGKLSLDKFFQRIGFEGHSSIPNQFLRMLNSGRLFTEVEIEKRNDEMDDDWLVFKFDKEDAAISPFKMPEIYK